MAYVSTLSPRLYITDQSGLNSVDVIEPSGSGWSIVNSYFIPETSQMCWVWKKDETATVSVANEEIRVIPDKPNSNTYDRIYSFSVNICDPTTWHYGSEYVDNILVASATGQTEFQLPTDTNGALGIIDVVHGKITEETKLVAPTGTYQPLVTVSGVGVTEREAYEATGGDYEIIYESGLLRFFEPQYGDVRASYYYSPSGAGPSFAAGPPSGKMWIIDGVEFQFTSDFEMTDTIVQNVSIVHPMFGYLFPYPDVEYRTLNNFTDWTYGSFPIIPKVGGPRGILKDTITLRWNYKTSLELLSSLSAKLESWSKHGRGFGGTRAVLAIYGLEKDEV